jgi:hypothetical protein
MNTCVYICYKILLDSLKNKKCFWYRLQRNLKKKKIVFHKLFSENRVVYEIMWKKYGKARQATYDNIIRHMRFACQVTEEN